MTGQEILTVAVTSMAIMVTIMAVIKIINSHKPAH
jgi:hypothetical protein